MKNKYTKKQLEKFYNCNIYKDFYFDEFYDYDDECKKLEAVFIYRADGLPIKENGDYLFDYADGRDLDELHENIRKAIIEYLAED